MIEIGRVIILRRPEGRALPVLTPPYKETISDTFPKKCPPVTAQVLGAHGFSLRKIMKKSDLKYNIDGREAVGA